MSQLSDQFRAGRLVSTPIFAVETPDMGATMLEIVQSTHKLVPVCYWDVCNGMRGLNDAGIAAVKAVLKDGHPVKLTSNPIDCLVKAQELPEKSILMMLSAHRYFDMDPKTGAAFSQAVWNLRNTFKQNQRSLVLLGPQFRFPPELQQDIFVLDAPLPSEAELEQIISEITAASKVPMLEGKDLESAVDALRGLAAFPAEQVTAMSCDKETKTVLLDQLWERKRRMIEITPGLSVFREEQTFGDIGGVEAAKEFFNRYIAGKAPLRCIVFIDEIEKAMAGSKTDSTGVAQGFHGATLTNMQDNRWPGSLYYGHPGVAKTALAKAIGSEAGVPTIYLDLGAMKESLHGNSERNIREAFRVIKAIGGDGALFIATCNDIRPLSPELRRRFYLPTFFFDLPSKSERRLIWDIYLDKFTLMPFEQLNPTFDNDWTGAEIENCCRLAYQLNTSPADTAKYIVPVAQSMPEEIEERRKYADNKFLSASRSGPYKYEERNFQQALPLGGPRRIDPTNN